MGLELYVGRSVYKRICGYGLDGQGRGIKFTFSALDEIPKSLEWENNGGGHNQLTFN